ncbi:MAG: hydrogenase maturation protease [Planctomycetaceae bacterium]
MITESETAARCCVIGIGSPHGDDQAGWLVVDLLEKGSGLFSQAVVRKVASPIEILHWASGCDHLILCDACQGTGDAGTITRFDWTELLGQRIRWSGSHDVSLEAALQLLDRLVNPRPEITLWGIEIESASPCQPPCETVQRAARELASQIVRDRRLAHA